MKRIILYCLILGVVLVIPVKKLDIGKLEPVQAVWAYKENGNIILETDTQDRGEGQSVEQALGDMKVRSPGIIYLDTAQYLLISEEMVERLPELGKHLKDRIEVCLWDGAGEIQDAARYMASHKNGKRLENLDDTDKLSKIEGIKENEKGKNNDLTISS